MRTIPADMFDDNNDIGHKPGITISPRPYRAGSAAGYLFEKRGDYIVNFVEFDLSVAVTSRVEGGAEAKAQLQVIGLDLGGAKLEGGIDHPRVQRIKFQV